MPRLTGVRVLAVDDNADSLEVLSALLVSSGAQVRVAASGAEALREWSREPADVLICDLAMPHVNGFDVLRGVRQLDVGRGGMTAAIALTAHASADYQTERAMLASMVICQNRTMSQSWCVPSWRRWSGARGLHA